ncbi:glycosyltransferase [Neobacillus drentensis]|uniref:glycosyltransferase n=1 Tax=Neobacillus drentensis TaxID=220684 RepID=UPI002FFE5AF9
MKNEVFEKSAKPKEDGDKYKFSVLMAVYHKEVPEFFDTAIESILCRQTLRPNEFVLICDGPLTKELDDVLKKYENLFPNITRIYRLDKNGGLGNALAFGLSKCTYSLIARADSDDLCDSTRFEKQIEFLRKNPKVDVLGTFIEEFDTDYKLPVNQKVLPTTHDDICKMATFRNPINHMTVMFKKEIIIKCGSYQHLPYLEDYYMWVRAIENGATLSNLDEYLVHARIGNGMVQRRSNKKYIESWKILNQYMLKHKMVSIGKYFRNLLLIRLFVYMPVSLKGLVYKNILRRKVLGFERDPKATV